MRITRTTKRLEKTTDDLSGFNKLGLLSALLIIVSAGFSFFVFIEAARRIDAASAARTRAEVAEALGEITDVMAKKAEEYSLWNEAVDNLVVRFDGNWANANVGPYAERLWGLDRSYAWNGNDTIIYASQNGMLRTDLKEVVRESAELMSLVSLARARRDAFGGLIRVGPEPFIFGVRIIEYEEGRAPLPPNPEQPVQVFLMSLDKELAKVASSHHITGLHFVEIDNLKKDNIGFVTEQINTDNIEMLPLNDAMERPFGHLAWEPERPSQVFLTELAPYRAGFLASLVVIIFVFARVWLRLKRQEPLRMSKAQLAQAQRAAQLGYMVHQPDDTLEMSDILMKIVGIAPGPNMISLVAYLDFIAPEDRYQVREAYRECWANNRRFDIEYTITRGNGETRCLHETGEPFLDADGLVVGLITAIRDITERKRAEEVIRHQATHDALTQLPNRALFSERLHQAIRRSVRYHEATALLFLDLDRFKQVNDTLGHQAGDELICEFAKRLSTLVRRDDLVARLGGDEFAIIQSHITNPADTNALCQRILECASQSFSLLGGVQANIGVSIGVAIAPGAGSDNTTLMRNADIALYQAKSQGRNRVCFFAEGMDEAVQRRSRLEFDLREALDSGTGLVVHYQPLMSSDGQTVTGLEALVRWEHPQLGMLMPSTFLPVADECGLSVRIDEWVLEHTCRIMHRLPQVPVSINLSAAQFYTDDLPERIMGIVRRHGVAPQRIELEITEKVLLEDNEACHRVLRHLRQAGFRIALDDFGTGYSSLSYLRKFQFDKIKIDQSFVRHMESSGSASSIVQAIITMGQSLGAAVTAEGVETQEQTYLLAHLGCDQLQGFLFSRPLPEHELIVFAHRAGGC